MEPKIENILFISDLSENSMPALAWSMMLAHRHDARITFLHVIENVRPQEVRGVRSIPGKERWTIIDESHRPEIDSAVAKRIHRFCGDVMAGMSSCPVVVERVVIRGGVPADVILKEIASNKYDLVAMGSDGVRLFKDTSMSRIARRVYQHGKIPVFVIPPQEKGDAAALRLPPSRKD
jgi:nucleotide-binding universal stress UspA family protein